MQLRKLIILVISIVIPCIASYAQTVVKYDYDNAGNRVYRGIIVMESTLKKGSIDSSEFKQKVMEDKLGNQIIRIYPNPTKGALKIEIQDYKPEMKSSVSLYSLKGSHLQTKVFEGSEVLLDLTNYPLGTYVLKIKIGDRMSEWKIVKE